MTSTREFFEQDFVKSLEAIYKTEDLIQIRRERVAALRLKPGERVIDIGAGPGFMACKMGYEVGPDGQVIGVDNNEMLVQLARERCTEQPHVRFETADATALPSSDVSFDVAVSTQVFEYVPDADRAIAEMYRVLRPGGRGLVVASDWGSVIWNNSDPERMSKVMFAFAEHCSHQHLPRTLSTRLESTGFEVQDASVRPQFNPTYDPNNFSIALAGMVKSFVQGRNDITGEDAEEWLADLHQTGQRGDYFFCLNQFMFSVVKPTSN